MKSEKVPTEIFVQQVFSTRAVQMIVNQWPIKSDIGFGLAVKHLEELGIYDVEPLAQGPIVKKQILFFLENSPAIIEAIARAKKAAADAARTSKNRAGRD
ncbi:MAG: hypothetical protein WCL28_05545 [bacterium]|jgi:hypothetical protein